MVHRAAGLCAVVVVAGVTMTGAVATSRVSAPLPPSTSFALAPGDFSSGGQIASQSTRTVSGVPFFTRMLRPGRIGSTTFLVAASLSLIEPDEGTAALGYAELKAAAQTKAGRQAFAKEFALEFVRGLESESKGKAPLKVKSTTVGAPVLIGATALRLPVTIKTNLGSLHLSVGVTQLERVVGILALIPDFNRAIRGADATTAITDVQQHLHDAFTVANTAKPTISGTATQGQVVTLDEGSWTGAPSGFTYAWSHCDANGASCAPIAGATAKTYAVGAADVGFTLQVTVTGTNSVGSTQGVSAVTAVVS